MPRTFNNMRHRRKLAVRGDLLERRRYDAYKFTDNKLVAYDSAGIGKERLLQSLRYSRDTTKLPLFYDNLEERTPP